MVRMKVSQIQESESELQAECERFLRQNLIEFFHWPDELNSFLYGPHLAQFLSKNRTLYNWMQGIRKLISKYVLGFPDLAIFKKKGEYNSCLFIELKTKKGSLTQAQKKFAKHNNVALIRDFETFREVVTKWEAEN